MADKTGISWTDATWNPIRGCSRVSAGCENCYAESVAARFSGPGLPYEGLAHRKIIKRDTATGEPLVTVGRWTGDIKVVDKVFDQPLRWSRPRRIFVNSMSDLFHEKVTNETIAAIFGVMAAAPRHTFQILTKRPERMRDWFQWAAAADRTGDGVNECVTRAFGVESVNRFLTAGDSDLNDAPGKFDHLIEDPPEWPLPNVHLGISAEDQAAADKRIPLLLETPAAIRFVSAEPMLGPIDFGRWLGKQECLYSSTDFSLAHPYRPPSLDWVIVGGESGPNARPFRVEWARSIVDQCAAAGVACFVKQLGAHPFVMGGAAEESQWPGGRFDEFARDEGPVEVVLHSRSGAEPIEWPIDLRVQKFPTRVP